MVDTPQDKNGPQTSKQSSDARPLMEDARQAIARVVKMVRSRTPDAMRAQREK